MNKINLKPEKPLIPHMARVEGKWQRKRPTKHPEPIVGAALSCNAYNKTGLQAPNVSERDIVYIAAMPDW